MSESNIGYLDALRAALAAAKLPEPLRVIERKGYTEIVYPSLSFDRLILDSTRRKLQAAGWLLALVGQDVEQGQAVLRVIEDRQHE